MSPVTIAIHIGLLALTIAILVPAGLTIIVLLIWEVAKNPETNTNQTANTVQSDKRG